MTLPRVCVAVLRTDIQPLEAWGFIINDPSRVGLCQAQYVNNSLDTYCRRFYRVPTRYLFNGEYEESRQRSGIEEAGCRLTLTESAPHVQSSVCCSLA